MPNRLKNETSPYLLQHADNPVDWYPWGEEAFHLARETDRPVFLSVGYSACHWCHRMAHESFEDPQIAKIMNERFVNIKVDREERPDVDSIYMDAVVAMTGQGGWPMSVFLTPQAKPFFGGTYFPPVARHNIPSFRDVLLLIDQHWREDRERLEETGRKLQEHIDSQAQLQPHSTALDPKGLERAAETLFKTYDWSNGGWGGAPKFPQATVIEFLLRKHHRDGDKLALEMAEHALEHMARGGLFDQISGGFHRYAVDAHWRVPHFEKMLYDNALLAQTYLHAWQVSSEPLFREIAERTLDFLRLEMRHKEGGFYAALDADSEGQEGKYYAWPEAEIRKIVSQDNLELFLAAYGVSKQGNFDGRNVLHRPLRDDELASRFGMPVEEISRRLAAERHRLAEQRSKRIAPATDDKILTAWNGLALSTFAEAARAFSRADYLHTAQTLAAFLLDTVLEADGLRRTWRHGESRYTAYLEDHAALAEGLLTLYQTDFNTHWFEVAVEQAEKILANFNDPRGGFFDTRHDHETLITRPKSLQDSPLPSGNSMAVSVLLKLAAITGDPHFREPAEKMLLAMQNLAHRYPTMFSGWLCNIDFAVGPQMQIAFVGPPTTPLFNELTDVVHKQFLPRLVIAGGETNASNRLALLEGRTMLEGMPSAYLCEQFTCKMPTSSPVELRSQISETLQTHRD